MKPTPTAPLLTLLLVSPLAGCSGVLDPRGPVGAAEKLVLFDSLAIMLMIVIPTFVAIFAVAWWFRSSNDRARYRPEWTFSGRLELIVWATPTLIITFLGGLAWFGSHALDPFAPLQSKEKQVEIQVVSLDWKWLFIYPNERIAAVNQLTIPAGRPIHFTLTSSGVMNSFFVPQLGSQIYTMASMTSQLNLQADRPGDFFGLSAQFSGEGFADMHFAVTAVTDEAYAAWVTAAQAKGPALNADAYAALAAPSKVAPPSTFNAVDPNLFASIVNDAAPPTQGSGGGVGGKDQPPKRGL